MNGFATAAPRPTHGPTQARAGLEEIGCCLLEGVLRVDDLHRARDHEPLPQRHDAPFAQQVEENAHE